MFITLSSVLMWLLVIGVVVAIALSATRLTRADQPIERQRLDQRCRGPRAG
jgi:hypothetical protein